MDTQGTGEPTQSTLRIVAGQWRPHYPAEQIAWVSPPWPSQDYLWLDFPEAVFCAGELLYLSHLSATHKAVYEDLPKVDWELLPDGLAFERCLPNGLAFGGRLTRQGQTAVRMELHLSNATDHPLAEIRIQTCAYLRAIREFAEFTNENKHVHLALSGWTPLSEALGTTDESATYRLGWRAGPAAADLPLIVTLSNEGQRLVAMTWGEHTYSIVGNPNHPCMHADPYFDDLQPGQSASIGGQIIFFEGPLAALKDHWLAVAPGG